MRTFRRCCSWAWFSRPRPAAGLAFGEDHGGDGRDPRHPDALASDLAAWGLWTLTMLGLVVLVWLDQLLRQTDRPELVVLNPSAFAPVLGAACTATVGAVVASRRPRHPVGWLLLAMGLSLAAAGVTVASTNYGVAHADPAAGLVPGTCPPPS